MGKYNVIWLCDLLWLVVVIKLVNTGVGAQKVTLNQCNTIQNLTLCIGAKVMLIQNIWVELGLVNGVTSIVKDVIQKEYIDVKKDQPQALLIAVNGYSGLVLFTWQDGRKVVFVFFVFYKWEGIKGSCLWRQFPVILAFAFTVYKSQGLILNWVVLDIKDKDNIVGLIYIAVLWVKKLLGLMFEYRFNKE